MRYSEQIFQGLETRDPKIKIKGNIVSFYPNYLNYSFLSILGVVIFFLIIYFLYGHPEDFWVDKLNFYLILVIIFFPVILIMELKFYNTVVINFGEKTILIIPNLLLRLIKRKKKFPFSEIYRFEPMPILGITGLRLGVFERPFTIGVVLKNSDKIKLLSLDSYNIAKEISERLSNVFV